MASVAPGQAYVTVPYILTGGSATDVYIFGTNGETQGGNLVGVLVTDSTGAVLTAATVALRQGGVNYVLASTGFALPSATENLEIVCEPAIRCKRGDSIRVTGANGHHVFVTYVPIGLDTGEQAQTLPGRKG